MNHLVSVTDSDPTGATTTFTYDVSGNVTSQTDANGNTTSFVYDSLNHLVSVTDPAGNTTTYTYGANGNRTSQTDANGNVTRYEYNLKGQLIKVIDALGNITMYTYGGSGCASCGGGGKDKLTSLTDANGNTTSYQYDSLGRLIKEADPLGNAISYSYDSKGSMASRTDANGNTISYSYDGLGRLLTKNYPDSTVERYTYDSKGNVVTASNRNISYTLTYDAAGKLTGIADSNGRTVNYQYNSLGAKRNLTYPDGSVVSYGYDNAGRLKTITNGGGKSYSLGYDNLGRRTTLTLPNGAIANYSYDSAGRLTNFTHTTSTGQTIASFGYTLDKLGNRLTKTSGDTTYTYTYDPIYRLTQVLSSAPGYSRNKTGKGGGISIATEQQKESYTYDPVGNRLTSDKERSYTYNQANQLLTNGGTYTYDKNGNLTMKLDGTATFSYSYDYENRLTKVVKNESGAITTSEYKYDPFGRRIERKVAESEVSTIMQYVYDNEDIILEYDGNGSIGNRYIHGPGIDEPLAVINGRDTYYYHADGLGSIVALSDSNGKTVQAYEYDSFGNLKDQKNRVKQPYTYTAREWDKEAGLYYYRARYYDAKVGRFISKDPIGFKGGINLYSYANNRNPVNWVDPLGLTSLIFNVRQGILWVHPERAGRSIYSMSATSGREQCMNKPECECKEDIGPIPRGVYRATISQLTNPSALGDILRNLRGDWGDWRVPLTPDSSTNTFGRSDFFLHGGAGAGSAGCIDIGGGLFGDATTDSLLTDLSADPDGIVTILVQ